MLVSARGLTGNQKKKQTGGDSRTNKDQTVGNTKDSIGQFLIEVDDLPVPGQDETRSQSKRPINLANL